MPEKVKNDSVNELSSDNEHKRLKAARHFVRYAKRDDMQILKRALATESVSWIKNALFEAIDRAALNQLSLPTATQDDVPSQAYVIGDFDVSLISAEAVRQTTNSLLHEIEPVVGMLKVAARSEIKNYKDSKTRVKLQKLDGVLEALSLLNQAARSPRHVAIDIPDLLAVTYLEQSEALGPRAPNPVWAGKKPFRAVGDQNLVELVVRNAIKNAIEATVSLPIDKQKEIVINWGSTNHDYWISVIDQGEGFVEDMSQKFFEWGTSTKEGSLGAGLPIAQQAAESLGGKIKLVPGESGGARFELRWSK